MTESPLKAHGRAVVMGALAMVLGAALIGAVRYARASWDAKANSVDVSRDFRVVLDSIHATHQQVDSVGGRVREMYCTGKAPGCR